MRLAVLAALVEPFFLACLTLMQARLESGAYLLVTLSQFLVKVVLSVLLVAWCDWGVAGVLGAMLLTSALYAFLLTARELARGVGRPTARQLGAMLRFALPFLPGGLCFFVLNYGDRYFLLTWHGREEVGTYALGYKLALAVGTLSLTPLQMVWGVQMYREAQSPTRRSLWPVVHAPADALPRRGPGPVSVSRRSGGLPRPRGLRGGGGRHPAGDTGGLLPVGRQPDGRGPVHPRPDGVEGGPDACRPRWSRPCSTRCSSPLTAAGGRRWRRSRATASSRPAPGWFRSAFSPSATSGAGSAARRDWRAASGCCRGGWPRGRGPPSAKSDCWPCGRGCCGNLG